MSKRHLTFIVALLLAAVMLAACGGETVVEVTRVVTETEVVETEPEVIEVTRVVEGEVVTEEVTRVVEVEAEEEMSEEEMSRMGGWLDTIVFLQEPNQDSGVARLAAGDVEVFADDIAGQAAAQAADAANIQTRTQYGLYDEIFFNVTACADENLLNPFQSPAVREAMNWAIDRDFVADELYNGLAVPKIAPISEAGADRARFAPEIRALEAQYAYDFERANEVITAEMEALGAVKDGDLWTFNGEPVSLIFLIRIEDTRLEIGNYVANQLEEMGFTIERVERTSGELGPIWIGTDPTECQWNAYTGAWSQTAVARDDGSNFDFFYTPRGYPAPSWGAMTPAPEFDEVSLRLANNDFANFEERAELFRQALPLALQDSARAWVTSRTTLVPFSSDIQVTTDLAAGISGSPLWSKTLRYAGEVGGSANIALPSVFTDAWNPVGGSNWVFDGMVQTAISDLGFYTDPYTGLGIPGRAEGGTVEVVDTFPMGQTLDWVEVVRSPEIVVPDDAWADWDAENQVFLTAGEVYTEPQTAVVKTTVNYPADLFETVTWHDGSPLTMGDFVMGMIMEFDQAKEASPYYDESLVPAFDQFMASFKGVRVVSTDPLTIETWSDSATLDAENSFTSWWPASTYLRSDAGWHNMAILLRGEGNGQFAMSPGKSEALEVEKA
ncbi:MAG: ABC transporter substrate-binding protein, partial [Candidatus Promineifilaceae bacterium]|nr:ABC transporter substrate-binding protein [Candidatus Promineifilaceae bacterium]